MERVENENGGMKMNKEAVAERWNHHRVIGAERIPKTHFTSVAGYFSTTLNFSIFQRSLSRFNFQKRRVF